MRKRLQYTTPLVLTLAALALPARAAVLPDDRADVLFHQYDGGGVTINGPSMLVRKKLAEKYSVTANYYVDMVSSASIDVMSTASPYKEERQQMSLGLDMLNGAYHYLDLTPKGRDEAGLPHTAAWLRRHDQYED